MKNNSAKIVELGSDRVSGKGGLWVALFAV